MSGTSSSWTQAVVVIGPGSGLTGIKNLVLLSYYEHTGTPDRSLMTSALPLVSSPPWSSPLFALLYFLFFLPPSPLELFRAKNKISSARALGKAALGLALARTDALNLWGFSALRGEAERDGGMDDGMEGSKWERWRAGVGGETCLYFLGIRRQMGALRGGLRSRPPWMAGKLTPLWLPCTLPACSPGLRPRPRRCLMTRRDHCCPDLPHIPSILNSTLVLQRINYICCSF